MKFKEGDVIRPIIPHTGHERATVMRVTDSHYYLKIMNGTAVVPIKAERIYELDV